MKINLRTLRRWIAALESGKYKQGECYLQRDSTYCCLGVACKLFITPAKLRFDHLGELTGTMPDDQPAAPKWLKEISDEFYNKTGISLTNLNDGGYTFTEICTLLELVYIHKILD